MLYTTQDDDNNNDDEDDIEEYCETLDTCNFQFQMLSFMTKYKRWEQSVSLIINLTIGCFHEHKYVNIRYSLSLHTNFSSEFFIVCLCVVVFITFRDLHWWCHMLVYVCNKMKMSSTLNSFCLNTIDLRKFLLINTKQKPIWFMYKYAKWKTVILAGKHYILLVYVYYTLPILNKILFACS